MSEAFTVMLGVGVCRSRRDQPSRRALHTAVFDSGWDLQVVLQHHRAEVAKDGQGSGRAVSGLDSGPKEQFFRMNLRSLFHWFSTDLAIDLGTANSLVFAKGKGIVVNEPSIVAVNKVTSEIVAVGKQAKDMLGRTPGNIVVIRPLIDGVIADFRFTEEMLISFIQKAHGRKLLVHPRMVIAVPSEITQVEKRAVIQCAFGAKASAVYL